MEPSEQPHSGASGDRARGAPPQLDLTRIANRYFAGDAAAGEAFVRMFYADVHRMAHFARHHATRPRTATLAHESWKKLISLASNVERSASTDKRIVFANRRGLRAYVRRVVETTWSGLCRRELAAKRDATLVELDAAASAPPAAEVDVDLLIDIATVYEELCTRHPRCATALRLQFEGLDVDAIARRMGHSRETVGRDLRTAREWLGQNLDLGPS